MYTLIHALFLLLICFQIDLYSTPHDSNVKPAWLDTVPPEVTVTPREKFHNKVISVSLSSSEAGTIWYGTGSLKSMKEYKKPFSLTRDGTYKIFYYADDDFGNKSNIDSIVYIIDSKPPSIKIDPLQGSFREPVKVHIRADEKCQYFILRPGDTDTGKKVNDSLLLSSSLEFRIKAVDLAGNVSISKPVRYNIDTASMSFSIDPEGGIYNHPIFITFKYSSNSSIWYTFDPFASQRWFTQYTEPVQLPYGLSSIRYFAKTQSGFSSDIHNARYIVDTIAPKFIKNISQGINYDTIQLTTREKAEIRYTSDGTLPVKESQKYEKPLILRRSGVKRIKARAWDIAGNASEIFEWEYKYDNTPPEIVIHPECGSFREPFTVKIQTNEPSRILYTLDNSVPGNNALLYQSDEITVSRDDTTILRVIAIDSAGNKSNELVKRYYLDSRPPVVKARIDGSLSEGVFNISLFSDEPSQIYYEIDGKEPSTASSVYQQPVNMVSNQVLKYFAVDKSGNRSRTYVMDELYKPMIEPVPGAGVYNRKISIKFSTNVKGTVYWRILPDTLFRADSGAIRIDNESTHTLEYYLETEGGLRSSLYRKEYRIDWTPPVVEVRTRKGINDSAIVFLRSNERATFYYTIDGSNPLTSSTVNTAGNKYLRNNDRIVLYKNNPTMKLSIYAEDAAGNLSTLSILDIFSPRAIPDIPASATVYNKAISIKFNTFDESSIYYTLDGSVPTQSSPLFTKPITLLSSDTIQTLVVDASGFHGNIDTFVYKIDLPPTPLFSIENKVIYSGDTVVFNASESFDKEDPQSALRFRWDFDNDGIFDTDTLRVNRAIHQFKGPGFYNVTLEVIDGMMRSSSITHDCIVKERCPDDMVSITLEKRKPFCIDKYEWPNKAGEVPLTSVSWVQAKMYCVDAGKRLCTVSEWESACNGGSQLLYPYGNTFEKERCPVEGKGVWKSGQFSRCEKTGTFDMLGNVWEWTEDKSGDYPLSIGGSFRYGKVARCNLQSQGTVATQSNETGFRCCK